MIFSCMGVHCTPCSHFLWEMAFAVVFSQSEVVQKIPKNFGWNIEDILNYFNDSSAQPAQPINMRVALAVTPYKGTSNPPRWMFFIYSLINDRGHGSYDMMDGLFYILLHSLLFFYDEFTQCTSSIHLYLLRIKCGVSWMRTHSFHH
jgi:hypothetical protein